MSLITRFTALAQAIAADIKKLTSDLAGVPRLPDFGWGTDTVKVLADPNANRIGGEYYVTGPVSASIGLPIATQHNLLHLAGAGPTQAHTQIATVNSATLSERRRMFYRQFTNGAWSSWEEFARVADILAARSWSGGFFRFSTSQTLTAAQAGRQLWFTSGGLTCTLPNPAAMAAGQSFTIKNGADAPLAISTPAGSIYPDVDGNASSSFTLSAREWAEIGTDGSNWSVNLRGSLVATSVSPVVTGGMTINGTTQIRSSIELGTTDGSVGPSFIDFHSGATPTDYDSRVICTGGTGTVGGGALMAQCGALTVNAGRVDINALLSANSSLFVVGPIRIGAFTMTTLPSAGAFSGYTIDVTNASGGPKTCRSNGSVWQILNTTTTVS